ncbi:hypothetical protein ACHWQZ_G007464 [Mnemiopsis leidyi]
MVSFFIMIVLAKTSPPFHYTSLTFQGELELICNKKTLTDDATLENIWLDTWKRKEAPMTVFYNKKK